MQRINENEERVARKSSCSLWATLRLLFINYLLYTTNQSVAAVEKTKRLTCGDLEGLWEVSVEGDDYNGYRRHEFTVKGGKPYNRHPCIFSKCHVENWDVTFNQNTEKAQGECEETPDGSIVGSVSSLRLTLFSKTMAVAQVVINTGTEALGQYIFKGRATKSI